MVTMPISLNIASTSSICSELTSSERNTELIWSWVTSGGRAKKAHPGLGACQSEKLELKLARSLCASGSITDMVRLIIHKSREKSYHCRRMGELCRNPRGGAALAKSWRRE